MIKLLFAIALHFVVPPNVVIARELTEGDADVTPREASDSGHDTSRAKSVAPDGNWINVQSITFTSPDPYKFIPVETKLRVPSLENNFGVGIIITADQEEISFLIPVQDFSQDGDADTSNADHFPMFINGMLKNYSDGKDPSAPVVKNWASTVGNTEGDPAVLMRIHQDIEEDDIVLAAPADTSPRPAARMRVSLQADSGVTKTIRFVPSGAHLTVEPSEITMAAGDPEKEVCIFATDKSTAWDADSITAHFVEDDGMGNPVAGDPVSVEDLTAVEPAGIVLRGRNQGNTAIEDGSTRFPYPETGNGKLAAVQYKAEFTPDADAERLKHIDTYFGRGFLWNVSDITGLANGNIDPEPNHGDDLTSYGAERPKHKLTAMPDANDGFGPFVLGLAVHGVDKKSSSGEQTPGASPFDTVSSTPQPELFFGRHDRGHPAPDTGDTANWYHYWAIEGKGADDAVCMFSRDMDNDDATGTYAEYWTNNTYFGKYDAGVGDHGRIYIGNKAADPNPSKIPFPKNPTPAGAPYDGWINFEIDAKYAPNFVNITFAHEATHRIIHKANLAVLGDVDLDGVPDLWESVVPVMRHADPMTDKDSFGNFFTISDVPGNPASRDEEFYCVLGGALSAMGTVTANPLTGAYQGVVPDAAKVDLDWTVDGKNWD